MMVIGAASVWLISLIAWVLAGLWEWKLPWRWQEGLAAWGQEQGKFSKSLSVSWYIEDESELEKLYWEMRCSLPEREIQEGCHLWVQAIVFLKEYIKKPACYARRFKDVQLRFEKEGEKQEI